MDTETLKLLAVGFVFGAFFVFDGVKRRRRDRNIETTPTSKLATAPQGMIEVEGFAWSKEGHVVDSLSQQKCVFYEFELQRLESRGSGKNRRQEWVTVFRDGLKKDFYVCDPTGAAVVQPAESEMNLKDRKITKWNNLSPQGQKRVEDRVGGRVSSFPPNSGFLGIFSSSYRVVEKEILLGSPLHVSGNFVSDGRYPNPVNEAGLAHFMNQVADIKARRLKDLQWRLDLNGDGSVETKEAHLVYSKMALASQKNQNQVSSVLNVCGVLCSSVDHPLVIGDDHEKRLLARDSRSNILKIVGGGALIVLVCGFGFSKFTKGNYQPWRTPSSKMSK